MSKSLQKLISKKDTRNLLFEYATDIEKVLSRMADSGAFTKLLANEIRSEGMDITDNDLEILNRKIWMILKSHKRDHHEKLNVIETLFEDEINARRKFYDFHERQGYQNSAVNEGDMPPRRNVKGSANPSPAMGLLTQTGKISAGGKTLKKEHVSKLIKDRNQNLIGRSEVNTHGNTVIFRMPGGVRLGWYDPKQNKSFGVAGDLLGYTIAPLLGMLYK